MIEMEVCGIMKKICLVIIALGMGQLVLLNAAELEHSGHRQFLAPCAYLADEEQSNTDGHQPCSNTLRVAQAYAAAHPQCAKATFCLMTTGTAVMCIYCNAPTGAMSPLERECARTQVEYCSSMACYSATSLLKLELKERLGRAFPRLAAVLGCLCAHAPENSDSE